MAEAVNVLLVRPSADEVFAALQDATRAVGWLHGKLRRFTPAFWRARVAEVMAQPEGWRQWEGPRAELGHGALYVVLAWWTDHQGGRHVRVCGGDTGEGEGHRHYSRIPEDPRPPLWHICPDRIFQRSRAGQSEWLASCSCGATGQPGALAWMGQRCGPCHDRREEAILPAESEPTTIHDFFPGPIFALAYSPDGSALAVARARRHLTYHHLTKRFFRTLFRPNEDHELRSLAFSPDGEALAAAGPNERGLRWFEVSTGQERWLESSWDEGNVERVGFSPDGRTLAGLSDGEGLEIWSVGSWTRRWSLPGATAFAYAADGGSLAAACAGEVRLFDTDDWSERGRFATTGPPNKCHYLDFTPDGRHLVLLTAHDSPDIFFFAPRPTQGRVEVWDVARRQERMELRATVPMASIAALSPDGRYLAWVVHDQHHSPGSITFWEVFAGSEHAKPEWDGQDMIYDLTFAPDGQTLATGSESGTVKLWPWRQLVEG